MVGGRRILLSHTFGHRFFGLIPAPIALLKKEKTWIAQNIPVFHKRRHLQVIQIKPNKFFTLKLKKCKIWKSPAHTFCLKWCIFESIWRYHRSPYQSYTFRAWASPSFHDHQQASTSVGWKLKERDFLLLVTWTVTGRWHACFITKRPRECPSRREPNRSFFLFQRIHLS